MIVLFTSNIAGGVLQFVIQILNELYEMNYSVKVFIPEEADIFIDTKVKDCVVRYPKVKTINVKHSGIKILARQIMDLNPALIWYFDNGIATTEVGLNVADGYNQMLIMHDAGGSHPSNNQAFISRIRQRFEKILSNCFEKKVNNIMLLSKESVNKYNVRYPDRVGKTVLLNLGAHVPNVNPEMPNEISNMKFLLFFGRIDKYKGIARMLKAYQSYEGNLKLIIAGNGTLTEEEQVLIKEDSRVQLINRFIKDEEMIWLFQNAYAVVLPYIEATQSGVIPIAYKYAKPVIVSNVLGLTQFVIDRKTGYVCRNIEEMTDVFISIEDENLYLEMKKNCLDYYNKQLEWKTNLKILMDELKIPKQTLRK